MEEKKWYFRYFEKNKYLHLVAEKSTLYRAIPMKINSIKQRSTQQLPLSRILDKTLSVCLAWHKQNWTQIVVFPLFCFFTVFLVITLCVCQPFILLDFYRKPVQTRARAAVPHTAIKKTATLTASRHFWNSDRHFWKILFRLIYIGSLLWLKYFENPEKKFHTSKNTFNQSK